MDVIIDTKKLKYKIKKVNKYKAKIIKKGIVEDICTYYRKVPESVLFVLIRGQSGWNMFIPERKNKEEIACALKLLLVSEEVHKYQKEELLRTIKIHVK